jgi:hypothetical protein
VVLFRNRTVTYTRLSSQFSYIKHLLNVFKIHKPKGSTGSMANGPTAARYITVGTTLLTMGTFAGTLTFTVLLTLSRDYNDTVRTLLGYASTLFLASITSVFPGIVALQPYSDEQHPSRTIFWMLVGLYSFAGGCMSVAFFLLMAIMKYYIDYRAFLLGMIFLSISTCITLFNSFINMLSYKKKIPWF